MRYIMKGGVWKNCQDEILKAAIMKYGLNQWSRISSLLSRKSAKQCKQRWYQWLDPSIKKTEWTRTEDEKLLQLARVFPSQWRTIAPFVGRTPTQCYERYEKLLDMAQGKTGKESEDLKKLRPGQIDPNPETKPARLDPIDMDEDQKEMLAEVRVRLANTKGKKAKRKEREKIIEEARRLAQLQKIRQLEMAGVENIPTTKEIKRMRQKKDIDYNKQIPFKREVPEFKYQLDAGQTPKNLSFAETITLQTLEGKRRDVEQQLQRKLDKRRMKKFKQRDLKTALLLRNDFEKPASFPIQLPEPQIEERDLQAMKKYNITTPLNSILASENRYGMTPQNKIMFSARVNLSLNHQELDTPANEDEVDGIQGLNFLKRLETEKAQKSQMRSIDRVISQRMKTPSHNQWQSDNTVRIKGLFSQLQKPINEIQFQIPQQDQQQAEEDPIMDAEQQEKKQLQKQKIEETQTLKTRSQVLKRNLPRPTFIPSLEIFISTKKHKKNDLSGQAARLIEVEMLTLIYSDAIDYPLQQMNFPESQITYKEQISVDQLLKAQQLVDEEYLKMDKNLSIEDYNRAKKCLKLNYEKREVLISNKQLTQIENKHTQIQGYRHHIEEYKQQIKRTDHHQKKNKKLMAGYQRLIKNKLTELNGLYEELGKLSNQKKATEELHRQERASVQSRIQDLESYYKLVYSSI